MFENKIGIILLKYFVEAHARKKQWGGGYDVHTTYDITMLLH